MAIAGITPKSPIHPRRGNPIHAAIERIVLPVDVLIRSYETFVKYRPALNSVFSRMLEDSEVLNDRRRLSYLSLSANFPPHFISRSD